MQIKIKETMEIKNINIINPLNNVNYINQLTMDFKLDSSGNTIIPRCDYIKLLRLSDQLEAANIRLTMSGVGDIIKLKINNAEHNLWSIPSIINNAIKENSKEVQ